MILRELWGYVWDYHNPWAGNPYQPISFWLLQVVLAINIHQLRSPVVTASCPGGSKDQDQERAAWGGWPKRAAWKIKG
jgi:hypothetical protein